MIVGIGNDILEMERVKKACKRESFLIRYFTEHERQEANGRESFLAGNFCVKESVAKAFGTGFVGFGPADIEVLRDKLGKPYVILHGYAKVTADALGVNNIHVSISNLKDLVSAVVVLENATN